MDFVTSVSLIAQVEAPVQQSYLMWMFQALGPLFGFLLPASGIVLFAGACLVVLLSRRPSVIASFLVFLPLPIMIGVLGSLLGFISAFSVIAASEVAPKPAEVAAGISTGLFSTLVGLLVTFPAFLVTSCGLFIRTVTWRGNPVA
jgi:hypothetical protein